VLFTKAFIAIIINIMIVVAINIIVLLLFVQFCTTIASTYLTRS